MDIVADVWLGAAFVLYMVFSRCFVEKSQKSQKKVKKGVDKGL